MKVCHIPDREFQARWQKVQEGVRRKGLDILLVHSNEADFANVRYLSDYWPIFESAGVLVPAEGAPALLIGPESETFAHDRSRIPKIYKLVEYRESAEPDYPTIKVDKFTGIFKAMLGDRPVRKIGLAGYAIFPLPIFDSLKASFPRAELIKSDDILFDLRMIKSKVELQTLQEAFRISEIALKNTITQMKPDMTELQVVGIIEKELYTHGAEYEAHPQYVLSGRNSTHAIGRPSYTKLGKGNLIQLNIGARVAGYSASVGRPVCFGKMPPAMRRLVEAGLELHLQTMLWMKAGVIAREVTRKFFDHAAKLGVSENALYGPCHGLGMIEVERPWMEAHSNYPLQENMTYQVDTFLYNPQFGLRWENGVAVTKNGVQAFSNILQKVIEL